MEEARACPIEQLAEERYPAEVDDPSTAYAPENGCDWAALAHAYGQRNDDLVPQTPGAQALSRALMENSAFVFTDPIFFRYIGLSELVQAPPQAARPLTEVTLSLERIGKSDQTSYEITISDINTTPQATDTVNGQPFEARPDAATVQLLGTAWADLVPVTNAMPLVTCPNHYPDWQMHLTYDDGTTLNLTPEASNIFMLGGPWQVEIDGQQYLHPLQCIMHS